MRMYYVDWGERGEVLDLYTLLMGSPIHATDHEANILAVLSKQYGMNA